MNLEQKAVESRSDDKVDYIAIDVAENGFFVHAGKHGYVATNFETLVAQLRGILVLEE